MSVPANYDKRVKYNDALHRAIVNLLSKGLTQHEVAEIVGIRAPTLSKWKRKYPNFGQEVDHVNAVADGLVEAAMFKTATGFSYDQEKAFFDKDTGQVIKETVKVYKPPSEIAGMFWLERRVPAWRKNSSEGQAPQINMLHMIINNAIAANPDNTKIIQDVVGEDATDATSVNQLQNAGANRAVVAK